jgi:hypothetical protein
MNNITWLAPILGFIGTVAVAALGYYQWRRAGKQREEADFNKERAAVLQTMVGRLQDLQLLSRNRSIRPEDLERQIKGLNEFLIENRLWVDPISAQQARQYIDALIAINIAMEDASAEDIKVFIGTEPGPYSDSVAGEFRNLASAEQALIETVRDALKKV